VVQYRRVCHASALHLRQRRTQFPPGPILLGLGYVALSPVPDWGKAAIRVSNGGIQCAQQRKLGSACQRHQQRTGLRYDQQHRKRRTRTSACSEVCFLTLSGAEQNLIARWDRRCPVFCGKGSYTCGYKLGHSGVKVCHSGSCLNDVVDGTLEGSSRLEMYEPRRRVFRAGAIRGTKAILKPRTGNNALQDEGTPVVHPATRRAGKDNLL
jgi:hypothetical protein